VPVSKKRKRNGPPPLVEHRSAPPSEEIAPAATSEEEMDALFGKPGHPPDVPPPPLRPHLAGAATWIDDHRAFLISAALIAGAVALFLRFGHVLMPFLVAFVLAYLLNPLITSWQRGLRPLVGEGDARLAAVILFYALTGTALLAVGIPLILALVSNALQMADLFAMPDVHAYKQAALNLYERYKAWIQLVPHSEELLQALHGHQDQVIATTSTFLQKVGHQVGQFVRYVATAVLHGGAGAISLALVPVALFYMLYDHARIARMLIELVPRTHLPWTRRVLGRVDSVLGGFVRGQMTIICIAMIVFTVGFLLIGIKYALLIGPLAGMLTFVPYLGLFGLVPAAIIALIQGGLTAVTAMRLGMLVVLALVWNALEGLVLQPRLIGSAVALHPLLVLLALGIGGELGGLMGLMLAVPTAALLKVLWEETRDVLYGSERWA
jgi:predicted PurR-regulated permease PerM